jgi:hypothetical protein
MLIPGLHAPRAVRRPGAALPALSLLVLGACHDGALPTAADDAPGAPRRSVATGTCVVTTAADHLTDPPAGSLRALLADAGCGTITFDAALAGGTIQLAPARLVIRSVVTITAPAAGVTLRAGEGSRVLGIAPGATAQLTRLTLTGGRSRELHGAGIENSGTLTLVESTVHDNRTVDGAGGGIMNEGTLTVVNSTISGNFAVAGGGIRNLGRARLVHSTVAGNEAVLMGGGVENHAILTVWGSLVAGNIGTEYYSPDVFHYREGSPPHVAIAIAHSLIGNAAGFHGAVDGEDGNRVGVDPLLGALSANGGATRTHALGTDSPAIDAGVCTDDAGQVVATDQRGVVRPQGAGCDMGAFEREHVGPAPVFGGFRAPVSATGWNLVRAGQAVPVTFSLGGDFGLDVFAPGSPAVAVVACPSASATSSAVGSVSATTSRLTYDALTGLYTYLWKTERTWAAGCRTLTLRFGTRPESHVAHFRFR